MGGLIAQFGYRGAFLFDAAAILLLGAWLALVLRRNR